MYAKINVCCQNSDALYCSVVNLLDTDKIILTLYTFAIIAVLSSAPRHCISITYLKRAVARAKLVVQKKHKKKKRSDRGTQQHELAMSTTCPATSV